MMIKTCVLVAFFFTVCSVQGAVGKPTEPFKNPYLADSTYPAIHGANADFSPLPGPVGPARRLRPDEYKQAKTGPIAAWGPNFSGPYSDGRRVIWAGGYDRVAKIDANTLEVLTTYALGGNTYFGDEEIERHIATMDQLNDDDLRTYMLKHWLEPFRSAGSSYDLISSENEYYMPYRAADNTLWLHVYGEADVADPASSISLRRKWKIPEDVFKVSDSGGALLGVAMTSDGHIALITQNGMLMVLTQDLKTYQVIKLPRSEAEGKASVDFFASFIRNGLSTDDRGGIYVVTRENMHRVQWTGEKLSLNEADGGWSVPYPNELGIGSGTTPGLMGWGPNEDHLVAIGDASKGSQLMVFWRDKIPDDWQGISGYPRRVAGVTKVSFGASENEQVQLENAPIIYGYGVFFNNTYPENRLADQGSPTRQWMAESFSMFAPGHGGRGGAMIRWNSETRQLEQIWHTQINLAGTVCTVSSATEIVYCMGARDREWTLEGVDWHTGESAFHYTLGKSQRFNAIGGMMVVAPDGAIYCGCAGGLGLLRILPKDETNH